MSPQVYKQKLTPFHLKVATQITSGRILRIAGGVPRKMDLEILKSSGLLELLDPGEKGLAGKGYIDDTLLDKLITPYKGGNLTDEKKVYNRAISSVRITIERTNGILKSFNILRDAFRHALPLHNIVFQVLCNLTNLHIHLFPLVKRPHRVLLGEPVRFSIRRHE